MVGIRHPPDFLCAIYREHHKFRELTLCTLPLSLPMKVSVVSNLSYRYLSAPLGPGQHGNYLMLKQSCTHIQYVFP